MPGCVSSHSHGQLVAKVPNLSFPDPRHTKVFPQERSRLDIEIIERDDSIEAARASQPGDLVQNPLPIPLFVVVAREEDFVDSRPPPAAICLSLPQALRGQKDDVAAERFARL